MTIHIEFLRTDSVEVIAEVTLEPGWFARIVFRKPTVRRFAVRTSCGWHWDDTGEGIDRDEPVGLRLEGTYYWAHEHPKRVAFAESRRRVRPDGTIKSIEPPS